MRGLDDVSWLLTLAVLIPVALAARGSAPPGRKKQPPPPWKRRSSWGFPLLVVGLILATVVITLGVRSVYRQMTAAPLLPPDVTRWSAGGAQAPRGGLPFGLDGALGEQASARIAKLCPRLSAMELSDAGQPPQLVGDMAGLECMGVLCEHPETAEALDPSLSPRFKLMCDVLFTGWKDRIGADATAA